MRLFTIGKQNGTTCVPVQSSCEALRPIETSNDRLEWRRNIVKVLEN